MLDPVVPSIRVIKPSVCQVIIVLTAKLLKILHILVNLLDPQPPVYEIYPLKTSTFVTKVILNIHKVAVYKRIEKHINFRLLDIEGIKKI